MDQKITTRVVSGSDNAECINAPLTNQQIDNNFLTLADAIDNVNAQLNGVNVRLGSWGSNSEGKWISDSSAFNDDDNESLEPVPSVYGDVFRILTFTSNVTDEDDPTSLAWYDCANLSGEERDPGFYRMTLMKDSDTKTLRALAVFDGIPTEVEINGEIEPWNGKLVFVDVQELADRIYIKALAPFRGYIYLGRY